ncbi:hypothetical protein AMATHDRAFT_173557 [Amanita thiersii Skay4041]|uniref:Knr4/Smi1-like domain-containing protein n=1 Tax=Amanita thiersii Skay4041 TaxID=703135 RepID=A0A2A9NPK3_9AGAR|nr:hypothetical protein AMATHDRAFT_173557 [Amanita thiersii Skay4041]
MGWLSSLFSFESTHRTNQQSFSPTHDLPFSAHSATFSPDSESSISPSYTYPPQGPSSYKYLPTFPASASRPTSSSLLPTHLDPLHTPLSLNIPYPPLESTWNRFRAWLDREYPELGDTLNYGILPEDLAQIELQFGFPLPAVIRESYLCIDGQEAESAAGCSEGLFFGLTLLPLEDVLDEWRYWREVDDDPSTGANAQLRQAMQSIPPGWVRREYSQRGWIPLIADKVGNYVGVDLNPAESGSVGQVIVFGRDFDAKVVLWQGDGPAGWAKWLANFVDELESGEGYEIGKTEGSDDSEDDLGYESYFYDGNGRGQGDGGGDNGAGGGLRLTGEYRGWNVLEAWADRSVRKWHEAGVVSEDVFSAEDIKGKEKDSVGIDVVELSNSSGAEVAIPVLADDDEPILPPAPIALGNVTNTVMNKETRPAIANLPTISVTKPPAPLPVDLPTPRDIVLPPSPPPSGISFDEDLELGQPRGMREVFHETPGSIPSRSERDRSPLVVEIPQSPIASTVVNAEDLNEVDTPTTISAPDPTSDLLTQSAPSLDTIPLEPVSSLPSSQATDTDPVIETKEDEPDTTIRLVGGGGITGASVTPSSPEEESQLQEETRVATPPPVAAPQAKKESKTHKKTKSGLANLKKLGQFGHMRKRDSVSSAKEDVPVSN